MSVLVGPWGRVRPGVYRAHVMREGHGYASFWLRQHRDGWHLSITPDDVEDTVAGLCPHPFPTLADAKAAAEEAARTVVTA